MGLQVRQKAHSDKPFALFLYLFVVSFFPCMWHAACGVYTAIQHEHSFVPSHVFWLRQLVPGEKREKIYLYPTLPTIYYVVKLRPILTETPVLIY